MSDTEAQSTRGAWKAKGHMHRRKKKAATVERSVCLRVRADAQTGNTCVSIHLGKADTSSFPFLRPFFSTAQPLFLDLQHNACRKKKKNADSMARNKKKKT